MKHALLKIRNALGFRSARAFYLDLQKRAELNFNYSYYSKIEQGTVIPSAQVIHTLCSLLPDDLADTLVLAYCAALFPDRTKLFRSDAPVAAPPSPQKSAPLLAKQRILTEKQVAHLAKSQFHYFAFLIFTLARTPITASSLEVMFKNADEPLETILAHLQSAKLIAQGPSGWSSTSRELRFPKAENDALKTTYLTLDRWDAELAQRFQFKKLDRKIQIRRISPRYIGLILGLSQSLQELLRAADEVQPALNDDVISFRLELYQGKLPG